MTHRAVAILMIVFGALSVGAVSARAQLILDEPPPDMAAADIVERRGELAALDVEFTNTKGERVGVGDYFDGERPVALVFGYFNCPVVCPVVFNNAKKVFNDLAWKLGDEYRALTISFDHTDTHDAARVEQAAALAGIDRFTDESAWPYLTGDAESIREFCDSVGWKYKYLPKTGDFSHPTAIIILSPDGRVSNYLYGVAFQERQLRLALVDASDGKVGDFFDRVLLRCYHYDPDAGSYVLAAQRVMTFAGLLTVALLSGVIAALVSFDRRRTRRAQLEAGAATSTPEQSEA
jgi:protein SCO1/2